MINVSFIIQIAYDMASVLMSPQTREKFRFLGTSKEEMRRALGEFIDVSVLPREYGGEGEMPTMDVEAYVDGDRYLRHCLRGGGEAAQAACGSSGGSGGKPGRSGLRRRHTTATATTATATTTATAAGAPDALAGTHGATHVRAGVRSGGADSPVFGPTYAAAQRLAATPTGATGSTSNYRARPPALYGPIVYPGRTVPAPPPPLPWGLVPRPVGLSREGSGASRLQGGIGQGEGSGALRLRHPGDVPPIMTFVSTAVTTVDGGGSGGSCGSGGSGGGTAFDNNFDLEEAETETEVETEAEAEAEAEAEPAANYYSRQANGRPALYS